MSTKKQILEAASLAAGSANADGTWKVRLISEGRGSSGIYTRELLENHHHAFDGFLSFKNHPGWDGPQERDFTLLAGQIVGETWLEENDGVMGVYGNYLPDNEYRAKLEQYKDKLGLSIYIEGSGYVSEDDGEFYVDWFNPEDPYGSVDVVIAPGARGRFLESMKKVYTPVAESKDPAPAQDNERKPVMDQELKDAFAAQLALLEQLVDSKKAKESADSQVEADDAAVAARVEAVSAGLDAVEAARDELFPKQIESLRAEAKKGVDMAPLIESAKLIRTEALEAAGKVTVTEGRVHGAGDASGFSLKQIAEV